MEEITDDVFVKENIEITKKRIDCFQCMCCPFGYLDIEMAINCFIEIGLTENDLFEALNEFIDGTGTKINDCDIGYIAKDHILQMIRTDIEIILNFDICNDVCYYTYGNYMDSQWNWSDDDKKKLQVIINKATKEQIEKLKENDNIVWFFSEIEIEFPEKVGVS